MFLDTTTNNTNKIRIMFTTTQTIKNTDNNKQHKQDKNNVLRHNNTNNTNKIRIMFLDTTTNKQHKQDKNNVL